MSGTPIAAHPGPIRPQLMVLVGLGGGTYVEFFILCDDFSIGEDGGRRAFGEWISCEDGRTQVGVRALSSWRDAVSQSLVQVLTFSFLIHS